MRPGSFLILALALSVGCFVKTDDTGATDDTGTAGPVDADGDGFDETEDCDDEDPNVNPDATEVCNDIDDDCDGGIDEDLATEYFEDVDGDTYGDPLSSQLSCIPLSGLVEDSQDCDDTDSAINPGASEVCDGVDNDCDGGIEVSVDIEHTYIGADGLLRRVPLEGARGGAPAGVEGGSRALRGHAPSPVPDAPQLVGGATRALLLRRCTARRPAGWRA